MGHVCARALRAISTLAVPAVGVAAFMGAPLGAAILGAAASLAVAFAAALATADADLQLLTLGGAKKGAFEDKVAVVVGASSGIGAALAEYLAKQGAVLVLSSRGASQLQVVKEACEAVAPEPRAVHIVPMDVTGTAEELSAYIDAVFLAAGGVDFLFLAAGGSQSSVVEETTMKTAQDIMSINAIGSMNVGRAFLPKLLQQGHGRIVPIASMAGRVPSPGQAEYASAKHALLGYFASVAAEVADRKVGVTVVCPGPIAGAEVRSVFGATGRVDKVEDEGSQSKKVPVDRCCELICNAAAHGVHEAWIAKHPVLFMAYLQQYIPGAADAILKKIGPKRARALRAGKSGYSYNLAKKGE